MRFLEITNENLLEIKQFLRTVPSANAEMTFPSADKDLLIFFASSSTWPSAPVFETWEGGSFEFF